MLLKALILSVTTVVALSVITCDARAWGCSRSGSFSGSNCGSFSHSGSSSGGGGNYSHSGSTTATGRYGNTDSGSHSGSGSYGYGGGSYHGPIRPEVTTTADAMVAGDSMRLRSADRMARPTQRAFIVVFGESRGN
jgi:hypothetical protein